MMDITKPLRAWFGRAYKNDNSFAAFIKAIQDNDVAKVTRLLEKEPAYVTEMEHFSMYCAVGAGNVELVKLLHQKGAEILPDAVAVACMKKSTSVLQYLEENGADLAAGHILAQKWANDNLQKMEAIKAMTNTWW